MTKLASSEAKNSAALATSQPVPIFLPIVLGYTAWVYKVLWGKVSGTTIERAGSSAY